MACAIPARQIRIANIPVRTLPPVLAGIRASKSDCLTFPCKAQWYQETARHSKVTLVYRCGGSTR
jgi:hypothetical protein